MVYTVEVPWVAGTALLPAGVMRVGLLKFLGGASGVLSSGPPFHSDSGHDLSARAGTVSVPRGGTRGTVIVGEWAVVLVLVLRGPLVLFILLRLRGGCLPCFLSSE